MPSAGATRITDVVMKFKVTQCDLFYNKSRVYTKGRICLEVCPKLPGPEGDRLGSFSEKHEFAVENGNNGIQDRVQYMQALKICEPPSML